MPIKLQYNINQILGELNQFAQDIEDDIIESMKQAGEDFVTGAREMGKSKGGFGDVTKALRSSIGYVIRKDGEIIFGDFKGNTEGVAAAKRAVEEVDKVDGLQLIGMAGMDYASRVESRGLNVITVQGDALFVDLKDYLKVIERKYNRK